MHFTPPLLYHTLPCISPCACRSSCQQYWWERFPGSGGRSLTSYMFTFTDPAPDNRDLLEHMSSTYAQQLGGYLGGELGGRLAKGRDRDRALCLHSVCMNDECLGFGVVPSKCIHAIRPVNNLGDASLTANTHICKCTSSGKSCQPCPSSSLPVCHLSTHTSCFCFCCAALQVLRLSPCLC